MRTLRACLVALGIGLTALPFAPGVDADELATLATAEVEAYALRVEYDIPLPVSPGTIPHVVGEVRRSSGAGETAKGLAAAPTHFDAVVGGTYYDPDRDNDQDLIPCKPGDRSGCNLPPQMECFYPGDLLDTTFAFPSDTKEATYQMPATSWAVARCGAGPEVELHSVGAGDGPAATVGAAMADALAGPREGVMHAVTAARASGVSIGGGAVTVDAIEASGASHVTGKPGGQGTEARVTLSGITIAGTTFSIANDRIEVGGQSFATGSEEAQSFIDGLNAGLEPSRCRIDLLTNPARYPQGFLLSRKDPRIGVDEERGAFAASMKAGLLVLCDLPDEMSLGTDLKPQRLQAVLGFAYTGAAAEAEPGGFGLGNLGDGDGFAPSAPLSTDVLGSQLAAPAVPAADSVAPPAAEVTEVVQPARAARNVPLPLGNFDMDPATRWVLAVTCLVGWAGLTHAGIRKLRGVLST